MMFMRVATTVLVVFAMTPPMAHSIESAGGYSVPAFAPAIAAAAVQSTVSKIEQPVGWEVQYQDATCVVSTNASGAEGDPPYFIKMGNFQAKQLLLMFSVSNEGYKGIDFPKGTKSKFVVDSKSFDALALQNVNGEFVLTVENSLSLQRSLSTAASLGIQVKTPEMSNFADIASLDLRNIPSATKWLEACNLLGAGALPQ